MVWYQTPQWAVFLFSPELIDKPKPAMSHPAALRNPIIPENSRLGAVTKSKQQTLMREQI